MRFGRFGVWCLLFWRFGVFGADLRPCQRVGTFECLRFGRFKKFNVFKRFNACLSAGVEEFGGFGRFGRFKKFNVFKRFNACLSQGIDEFGGFGRFGLVGLRSLMCLRGLMPACRQGLTS
jgi:hypothetical protein